MKDSRIPVVSRARRAAFSALLAAAIAAGAPALALATTGEDWANVIESTLSDPSYSATGYDHADEAAALSDDGQAATTVVTGKYGKSSDAKFDLRDPNGDGDRSDSIVTAVKRQHPWGTCWGFSAIAACESSLLSEMNTTYSQTPIDLSEMQLVASTFRAGGAPESVVGKDQAGEGFHTTSSDPNVGGMTGGEANYGSSLFAAGIGPLNESLAEYKNAEGIMECKVIYKGYEDSPETQYLTKDEVSLLRLDSSVKEVIEKNWAGNYVDAAGNMVYTDWTLPESLWSASSYEFDNSNVLPDTVVKDAKGNYESTDMDAVAAIKGELVQGRAVSVAFHADSYNPNQSNATKPKYMNTQTWAHYTYDNAVANHAVCIVGWDDDFSADNFSNEAGLKPEGNGAWLIKNSWGSDTEEFPNGGTDKEFGIVENGQHTGYFWLSYYDHSICDLETFEFDLTEYSDNESYVVDQYDYMASTSIFSLGSVKESSSANIYTAEEDMAVRALSCMTAKPNTTVDYKLYLLDDKATTPDDPEHSTLVYEISSEEYQYGGYHRLKLSEDNWIALRKGQRYAVVTTQKCNDDGKYYVVANSNNGKPTEKDEAEIREYFASSKLEEVTTDYYNKFYNPAYAKNLEAGMNRTEAAAAAKATAEDEVAKDDVQAQIKQDTEKAIDDIVNSYFVAKVNEGESFTNMEITDDETVTWVDWAEVSEYAAEKGRAVDNLPIKAYGELSDWAEVDELAALESAIAKAKAALASATISRDGTDVDEGAAWMTQDEYDALSAAVAAGQELLDAAGGATYRTALANTTPGSAEVNQATAALAFEAHTGARAVQPAGEKDAGDQGVQAKSGKGKTPATGDVTGVAAALLASGGAASLLAARVSRRRNQ